MKEEEYYQRLSERMDHLEAEMKEIRSLLEEKEVTSKESEETLESSETTGKTPPREKAEVKKKHKSRVREKDWESLIGQVWLPRVFIIVLLIGVVSAFQSAVENNWITEPIRILIGFVSAVGLTLTGVYQIKKQRKGLGISLIGGGAGIWIFSTFAGTILYEMIPASLSFSLYGLGIGVGLYLSHLYKSQTLAVLLTVTGFFVPFLVGGEEGNFFIFFSYELVLLVVLGLYAWRKDYTFLLYATTLLPALTFAVYEGASAIFDSARNGVGPLENEDIFALTVVGIHVCLSVGMFRTNRASRAKGTLLSLTLVTALMWLYATRIFSSYMYEFGWMTLTFSVLDTFLIGGILLYGWIAYQNRRKQGILFHLYTLFAVVLAMLELFRIFNYEGYTILLLMEAIALYRLGFGINSRIHTILASLFFAVGALWTLDHIQYIETVWDTSVWEGLVVAVVSFLAYRLFRRHQEGDALPGDVQRFGIYAFASLSIGYALLTLTQIAYQIGEQHLFDYRDVLVSVSWTLFAVATLTAGIVKDKKPLRLFSILWIFITVAKAFLVDIAYIDATVRGLLFIGLGIVGVLVSRFFYRSNKEEDKKT
ncbi:DUF2339 domain-containing protein [Salimicrobium halophilum]|nr:DUF2339 domain-containing protein [Salimicrobium halophilum]